MTCLASCLTHTEALQTLPAEVTAEMLLTACTKALLSPEAVHMASHSRILNEVVQLNRLLTSHFSPPDRRRNQLLAGSARSFSKRC